jgi:cell division protein FtsL
LEKKMTRIVMLLVAAAVATTALSVPVRAEMAQQSTTEKVKTMTKKQWAKLQAEWKKDKAKFTACNDKSKADKLKGRKRWAAIYDCMMQ